MDWPAKICCRRGRQHCAGKSDAGSFCDYSQTPSDDRVMCRQELLLRIVVFTSTPPCGCRAHAACV